MLSFQNKGGGKQTAHENKGRLRQKGLGLSAVVDLTENLASHDMMCTKELQWVGFYKCLDFINAEGRGFAFCMPWSRL